MKKLRSRLSYRSSRFRLRLLGASGLVAFLALAACVEGPEPEAADLVILSRDLFAVPMEEVKDFEVVTTIVDGNVVYSREPGGAPDGERSP